MYVTDPGICTRVFTTFKCRQIGEKSYLVADYSQVCGEGRHAQMSIVMVVCGLIYVVGIPMGSVLFLFCNKKLLSIDEENALPILQQEEASRFAVIYGSLYDAYEPKYWWFEAVIMLQKAVLTGGLVLVAPGSSVQILVGLVLVLWLFFMEQ